MPTTSRDPPCGPVSGYEANGVYRFTGIPYANAPRFKMPTRVESWKQTLVADKLSPACPQIKDTIMPALLGKDPLDHLERNETLLYLSVTTPMIAEVLNPVNVMVWIYGGAFVTGAGDAPMYDPSKLVKEQNVIVVNINYRLGLLGFLGDGFARPANLALFDQIQALRSLRENIAAFGGNDDPASITVFGQSAGGASVHDLMLIPEASTLFARVIVQSAPFGARLNRSKMNEKLLELSRNVSKETPVDEVVNLGETLAEEGRN